MDTEARETVYGIKGVGRPADAEPVREALATLFVLLLAGVSLAGGPTLDGAWRSNRKLTLAGLRQIPGITPKQWSILADPGLFGHLIQVFHEQREVSILENRCDEIGSFETLASTRDSLTIRYDDRLRGTRTVTLRFRDGNLLVPMRVYGADAVEVFSPVSLADVRKQYPCVEPLLR